MAIEEFSDLDEQTQEDLLEWLNVRDVGTDDKRRLLDLYNAGKFRAWNCVGCGDRCREAHPDNWDHFQGVNQVDRVSYLGDTGKYTEEYLADFCDSCRAHP